MASYIDWYLVELERRLRDHVSPETCFTVLAEVEDHLQSKVSDLASVGMTATEAERTAAASFGQPERVAFEITESHYPESRRNLGSRLVSLGALVSLTAAAAVITIPTVTNGFWEVAALAAPIGLLLVMVGSLLARRLAAKQIACAVVPIAVLTAMTLPWGHIYGDGRVIARTEAGKFLEGWGQDLTVMREERSSVESGLAYYRSLAHAHGNSKLAVGTPPRDQHRQYLVIPFVANEDLIEVVDRSLAVNAEEQNGRFGGWVPMGAATKPIDAMQSWLVSGPKHLRLLDTAIARHESAIGAVTSDIEHPKAFDPRLVGLGAASIIIAGTILMAFHTAIVIVAYRIRRARLAVPRRLRA